MAEIIQIKIIELPQDQYKTNLKINQKMVNDKPKTFRQGLEEQREIYLDHLSVELTNEAISEEYKRRFDLKYR